MTDEQTRLTAVRRHTDAPGLPASWSTGDLAIDLRAGSGESDDCAVLDVVGRGTLVVGSDYIRGVKFRLFERGLLTHYDLGWYLAMANVSDIAAMGAEPVGLLTVVRYPKDMPESEFDAVMKGVADACRTVGANPLGGDVGSAERLFLSATAFGICEEGRALRRNGARPGDVFAVTGPIGTPAAAMVFFDRVKPAGVQLPAALEDQLLAAWRRPVARVPEGRMLAAEGAHACQDVSDGLRDTVEQLCHASGVGCRISSDALPIEPSVRAVAEIADLDAVALALGASVDFELACALAPETVERCRARFAATGAELHVVGEFTADRQVLLQSAGASMPLPGASWDHLSDDPADALASAARRSGEQTR